MTTSNLELHPVPCAICGTDEQCVELYSANFTPDAFNPAIFSARRLPDRIHYRMVRCTRCGLVRADPVADPTLLAQLYAQSTFEYGDETANLQWSYGSYLDRLTPAGAQPHTLLEIGCGNGFFLEEAERRGYVVHGVEPSTKACAQAPEHLRARICNDIMRPGLFPPASFDAICLFQVIDHISDPAALDNARREFGDTAHIQFEPDPAQAAAGAHALVFLTDWDSYRHLDFAALYQQAGLPTTPFSAEQMVDMLATLPKELALDAKRATVRRLLEEGYEVCELTLPALFTVVKEINEPRTPSLRGKMKAKSAQIPTWSVTTLGLDPDKCGLKGSPTQVVKIFSPEHRAGGERWDGDAAELAGKMLEIIRERVTV